VFRRRDSATSASLAVAAPGSLHAAARIRRRYKVATLLAMFALAGAFASAAFAYVFDTYYNSYISNGGHITQIEGTYRFYLFGQASGSMGSASCITWHNGNGACLSSDASYLYSDGQLSVTNNFCDIYGRGATVTCQDAY